MLPKAATLTAPSQELSMTFTRALRIVAGVLGGVLSYVVCVGIFASFATSRNPPAM